MQPTRQPMPTANSIRHLTPAANHQFHNQPAPLLAACSSCLSHPNQGGAGKAQLLQGPAWVRQAPVAVAVPGLPRMQATFPAASIACKSCERLNRSCIEQPACEPWGFQQNLQRTPDDVGPPAGGTGPSVRRPVQLGPHMCAALRTAFECFFRIQHLMILSIAHCEALWDLCCSHRRRPLLLLRS